MCVDRGLVLNLLFSAVLKYVGYYAELPIAIPKNIQTSVLDQMQTSVTQGTLDKMPFHAEGLEGEALGDGLFSICSERTHANSHAHTHTHTSKLHTKASLPLQAHFLQLLSKKSVA